jgi:hypothetical protein
VLYVNLSIIQDSGLGLSSNAVLIFVKYVSMKKEVRYNPVNIFLAHSDRLCTQTHPPVIEAGLVRVDDGAPVTDFSWACPNPDWSCWNKFHNFYLEKGLWSSHAGLVNEEKQRLDVCRRHNSSLLNWMKNEVMGIEDHRGGASSIG